MSAIESVIARELVDARGWPALEVEVVTESGATGRGSVAAPRRDARARLAVELGLGTAVQGMDALDQPGIDRVLVDAATRAPSPVGTEATLAVSLAVARAAAESVELPLWRYLGGAAARVLPTPLVAVPRASAGGVRVLVVPNGAPSFAEALRVCGGVLQHMEESALPAHVSGAAANAVMALSRAVKAIEASGAKPGDEVSLAIDGRGDDCRDAATGRYRWSGGEVSSDELIACYEDCVRQFPVAAILRACAADDRSTWAALAQRVRGSVELAVDASTDAPPAGASAVLLAPDRIGTVSESLEAMRVARDHGPKPIVARGSGDTEDGFLADFAVATHAGRILAGSFGQGVARYNQLMRIAWALGDGALY